MKGKAMNGNKTAKFQMSERLKELLRILLLFASVGLPYYFRSALGMEVALADLLYAPVILMVMWWPTGGTFVALSLSLLLMISRLFVEPATPLLHDLQTSLTLCAIVLVMSALSRQAKEAEQEIRQRNQELSALNAIASTASQSLNLDEILEVTFDKVLETIVAEAGGIYLLDEGEKRLVPKVYHGVSPEFVEEAMNVDDGLAGQGLRSGEPIVVEDISKEPGLTRMAAKGEGLRSYISVPLKSKDKVLGVMDVITRSPRRFAPRDVELLTSIGNQIGVAIENARLYREAKQREQEARALYELTKSLASLDYQQIIESLIGQSAQIIDCHVASLLLVGRVSANITSKIIKPVSEGFLQEVQQRLLDSYETLSGQKPGGVTVDLQGKVKAIEDEGQTVKSFLTAPLIAGGRMLGLLNLSSPRPNVYTERDLRLLSTVNNQATTSLENVRLFADLERAKAELERWSEELEIKVEGRTKELKEAQDRLLRAERLAITGQFGASVGHELRNPLGVIKNSAYYLKMKLGNADEKVKKHLKIIEREISISNKIINDLLNFTGVKEPTLQETDVNFLVKEALSRSQIPTEVAVVTKLMEELSPLVADPHQIEQVFINMISNAVQAMSDGGRLEIVTKAEDGFIVTEFKDNGCGIPEENLEKIFEPLFTTKAKGIGLGLAVSRTMVEGHGGIIEVESPSTDLGTGEVGKGTSFTVKLPISGD